MDLINRYVYAVTKSLPEKQREDIEKELRTLIDDMLEQCEGSEPFETKVQKVLLKLGDPEILAENYRGSKRYLIGPKYYDKYILILKIVFGAVFAGISIAFFVESIFSRQQNIYSIISGYLSGLLLGLLQAFAWITIGFVIAERNGMNIKDISKKDMWNVSQLPKIPEKKAMISPAEPIISILFSTIFLAILYSAPQLFAAYIPNDNGVTVIPIFNSDVLLGYRILLVCVYIFTVLREVLKLVARRWTLKLSVSFSILSVISTILMLVVFTNKDVWNKDFSTEIMSKMSNLTFDFANLWARLKPGFILVVIFAGVIDILTTLYKGIKYNVSK